MKRPEWLPRLVCWLRGHPMQPHRQFFAGTSGGITATEEWRECLCGKRVSGVTRTRIARPYGEVGP